MSAGNSDYRSRLARVLGKMGSSFDAEVLTAAKLANRMVRDAGMTWPEVLAVQADPEKPVDVFADWPARWQGAIALCQRSAGLTKDWDRQFVATLACYQHRPSDKQLAILREVTERVLRAEMARS
jgi:hypothetical protein